MLPVACLFDFDGVVVNSFKTHNQAWKAAFLELFGVQIPDFPHNKLSGNSPKIISSFFCEQVNQKEKAEELFELKGIYLHRGLVAPELLPGVREITKFLSLNGLPYGIASNATRQFVGNSIKQLDLDFETFFGFEDYIKPKPDPEAYLSLAKALGIPKAEFGNTWVFEDSKAGTNAAKEAGMVPVGIMTQFDEAELRDAGSQLVFPTLKEAWEYLETR